MPRIEMVTHSLPIILDCGIILTRRSSLEKKIALLPPALPAMEGMNKQFQPRRLGVQIEDSPRAKNNFCLSCVKWTATKDHELERRIAASADGPEPAKCSKGTLSLWNLEPTVRLELTTC